VTIKNHILQEAKSSPSPNFSGTITPKFLVMHYTAAWTVAGTLERFADASSDVSAQLTIDVDGDVYQHVPFNKAAWHAGPSSYGGYSGLNQHSVGIEFVNPGFLKKTESGDYLDAYGSVKDKDKVGPTIKAKNARVGSGDLYWPLYPEAQIAAGADVVRQLIKAYPTIMDIVTHEQIDTRGWKTDPGPAFPMNRFRALLRDRKNDVVHYEVTSKTLNVRGGPGTTYQIIREIKAGTKVNEIKRDGAWIQIDENGWVHSSFLRLVR
jgi:N-acetylmuramoyl-L-alanine amidase